MLRRLTVSNYLLIEHLELDLGAGLTVITGETGSGKSILLGALGLLLGERAEGELLRDPGKRCVIELEVAMGKGSPQVEQWCERNGSVPEDPMLLRRQLEPGGRSRAFVNDTPVRLEQLRELGRMLVHVHSQHQTALLHSPVFQLGLLDQFASNAAELKEMAEAYMEWRKAEAALARLREEAERAQSERDYLKFQFDELEAAKLLVGEGPELERALLRADHAEELTSALGAMEQAIAAERGISTVLAGVRQHAAKAARLDPAIHALLERLHSADIELKDIAEEAARLAEHTAMDPKEVERLRERSDLLTRLHRKHRVDGAEALIELRDGLGRRLERMGSLEADVQGAEERETELHRAAMRLAERISAGRANALEPMSAQVDAQLKELGMPHSVFRFDRSKAPLSVNGIDAVRALFSANKDRKPEPLEKVASGGELGRVMLALIGLTAATKELPTVIFDEIDTGVSGETAHRVGALLKSMAHQRQVIAISHLPQIASKADTHLLVTKDQDAEQVESRIRPLEVDERVEALARMLSGKKTTKAAIENAKELLKAR